MLENINPFLISELEKSPLKIIAGPCSAETKEQVLETAAQLSKIGIKIFRAGVWKPRTKPGGFCGVGLDAIPWLHQVKQDYGMKIAIEVAKPEHVKATKEFDIFWIGARTVADPFAVQSLADEFDKFTEEEKNSKWIFVKNPVSPDLALWIGAIERFYNAGFRNIAVIHRGFTSIDNGIYRNNPEWSLPISLKSSYPNISMFCDPSHISGKRELIPSLCQQALDLGFDGLMIESHYSPEHAWTDAAQQIEPASLNFIIDQLVIRDNFDSTENMKVLRTEIDVIDDTMMTLLMRRFRVCREIGKAKKEHNMPIIQSKRFNEISQKRAEQAHRMDIDPDFVRRLFNELQNEAIRQQLLV